MYWASIAAPPLSTVRLPSGAAVVSAAAPLAPAERTSSLVILPPAPVPWTFERSTPSAAATRAATGVALLSPLAADGEPAPSVDCAAAPLPSVGVVGALGAAALACMRPIT